MRSLRPYGLRWIARAIHGRTKVYLEPRDAWVGVYVSPDHIYACPLPFVVVRWAR
jgi:hypothetical protein